MLYFEVRVNWTVSDPGTDLSVCLGLQIIEGVGGMFVCGQGVGKHSLT